MDNGIRKLKQKGRLAASHQTRKDFPIPSWSCDSNSTEWFEVLDKEVFEEDVCGNDWIAF